MKPEIARTDLIFLMSREEGRRTLFRIIEASGMFASTYGSDGRDLAMREGRRSLGLEIIDWLVAIDPMALVRLLEEGVQSQKEPVNVRRTYDREDRDD